MGRATREAIALMPVELADRTVPVGEIFDCPLVDYDLFVKMKAIREPKAAEKRAADGEPRAARKPKRRATKRSPAAEAPPPAPEPAEQGEPTGDPDGGDSGE